MRRARAPIIYTTQITSLQMLLRAVEMDTRFSPKQFHRVTSGVNDLVQVLSEVSTQEPSATAKRSA